MITMFQFLTSFVPKKILAFNSFSLCSVNSPFLSIYIVNRLQTTNLFSFSFPLFQITTRISLSQSVDLDRTRTRKWHDRDVKPSKKEKNRKHTIRQEQEQIRQHRIQHWLNHSKQNWIRRNLQLK